MLALTIEPKEKSCIRRNRSLNQTLKIQRMTYQHFKKCLNTLALCLLLSLLSPCTFSANKLSTDELKKLSATKDDTESQYLLGYRYEIGRSVKRNHKIAIDWYIKAAKKKHKDAQYRLGKLYYQQKKYEKARYWLGKRAKDGHAHAQYYFANTFRYALGTREQTSRARKWYQKAAKQGHAKAQYELGLQYKRGIGARTSNTLANKWLKKAAKQGHSKAKSLLAKNKSNQKSVSNFEKANLRLARKGDAEAQFKLGKAYKYGKKLKRNHKKSFYWLSKAAKQNHKDAQYELALTYFKGNKTTKKDLTKAKKWFAKAANQKHKNASRELDKLANLAKKNRHSKQFNDMIDAALLDDSDQQYELGMRYLMGFKTAIDEQQAIYWLTKAADQNHPLAQYKLANQFINGKFVNQDIARGVHYFVAASKQNVLPANLALKHFAENGYKETILAEQGDKNAQYKLAKSLLKLNDRTQKQKGVAWLKAAAEQSHDRALSNLGDLYQKGDLIEQNYEKAFSAYTKAAELNDADAQFQLSLMYRKGLGTKKDPVLASRWLSRAASQGQQDAQKALQFSGI